MINLIPENAKKKVALEYWTRVVSVWMFVLSVSLVVVSLLLLPVYVLVTSQVNAYSDSAERQVEKISEFDSLAVSLKASSKQAQQLVQAGEVEQFSDLIDTFNSLQNEVVGINEMQFNRADKNIESVKLGGQADTRQALADFRSTLLALPEVESVELPLSNLAKDSELTFSLTVILVSKK